MDELGAKITKDFWEKKMADWQMEEKQIRMSILALKDAESGD